MAKNIGIDKIKDKRETLVEQFNSLQDKKKELLSQIELVDTDIDKINTLLDEANKIYVLEKEWRKKGEKELLPQLIKFDDSIKNTIGLRLQERLTKVQAKYVAACRATHTDISLNF